MATGSDVSAVLVVEAVSNDERDRLIKSSADNEDKVTLIEAQPKPKNHPFSLLFNYLFNNSHGYTTLFDSSSDAETKFETNNRNKPFHKLFNSCWTERESDNRRKIRPNHFYGHFKRSLLSYYVSILLLILIISLFAFSAIVFYKTHTKNLRHRFKISQHHHDKYQRDRWLVSTSKCHIPKQDPWDKSIAEYIWRSDTINCSLIGDKHERHKHSLSYVVNNTLFFTKKAIKKNALKECCYYQVSRAEPSGAENDIEEEEKCEKIDKNGFNSPFSVIRVACKSLNYTNYHSFFIQDEEEEKSCKRNAEKNLKTDQYYNILLVGVDTVSRLNAIRQFNSTLDILKNKFNTTLFSGYNKVGENTFPNLVPFLAGLSEEQLVETGCWRPTGGFDPRAESGSDYFDRCKFLWNYFQDLGYRTYYSEDWAMASTFNYLKWGFKEQPTYSYGRPFVLARDEIASPQKSQCKTCVYDKPLVEIDLDNLETFIVHNQKNPFFALNWINCPQHDGFNDGSQIDSILTKFFQRIHPLTQENTFVIFFSDHGMRYGDFVRKTRIGYYESSLPLLSIATPTNFIKQHPKLYENLKQHTSTLLTPYDMFKTLLSLHNLVKKEVSNSTSPPPTNTQVHSVKKANASEITEAPKRQFGNLEFNVTGPTAVTVIRQEIMYHGDNYPHKIKMLSLFDTHTRHELDRSCQDVGIPDNYCRCHNFQKVSLDQIDVLGAAYYLVYHHLYEELATKDTENLCAPLDFYEVKDAEKYDLRGLKNIATEKPLRKKRDDETLYEYTSDMDGEGYAYEHVIDLPLFEYKLQVSTQPGEALFGEVIRYRGDVNMTSCEKAIEETRVVIKDSRSQIKEKSRSVEKMNEVCKFDIHDTSIARLNAYRGQTDCLKNNAKLAKICYCKDLLEKRSHN